MVPLCFLGSSFAAGHLMRAAVERGCIVTDEITKAGVIFVSEDTPTDETGKRDLAPIRQMVAHAALFCRRGVPIVVTSQLIPGTMRGFDLANAYHQAETLRVKDAWERAFNPEQMIVGSENPQRQLPEAYFDYLRRFSCPIHRVSFEEAEFSKIAINMTLASQVENATRLAAAAQKCGAQWSKIVPILQHDKRIGPESYLQPGDWKESRHLLRDYVTLKEIENG